MVLHFVGADSDDIAYLRETERNGLLAPENPALQASVARGAQLVRMPRLACMTLLDDKRLRFTEANGSRIGLTDAQRVLMWSTIWNEVSCRSRRGSRDGCRYCRSCRSA